MGRESRSVGSLVAAAAVLGASVMIGAAPASASGPTAGLSIQPAGGELTVKFVADSTGFPASVVSYTWNFGDGHTTTTPVPHVTHTYQSASQVLPSVVETDSQGDRASASATLALFQCLSPPNCTGTLSQVGTVQSLQVSGPIAAGMPAGVNLLVGQYRILHCERSIDPGAAFTDFGFTGNLTAKVVYTTSQPNNFRKTCFASTVAFKDSAGAVVHSGLLPQCAASAPVPPCVESASLSGSQVTKTLLVPPNDPKVGVP